jgi:hypothetical protein
MMYSEVHDEIGQGIVAECGNDRCEGMRCDENPRGDQADIMRGLKEVEVVPICASG